jgi:hypothetical protein
MAAWDHDHGQVLAAFGDDQLFADCLSEVAPPLNLPNRVRLWRGVEITRDGDPAYAPAGVSWTRSREVACWFAFRFGKLRPRGTPTELRPALREFLGPVPEHRQSKPDRYSRISLARWVPPRFRHAPVGQCASLRGIAGAGAFSSRA